MASDPISFYFDFSSPYAYLAAVRIDAIAERHDRLVDWRPILLGAIFKETGGKPLTDTADVRWRYAQRDMARSARLFNIPFALPPAFPFSALAATRAFYRIAKDDRFVARDFALSVFEAAFARGLDVAKPELIAAIAAHHGVNPEVLSNDIALSEWKDRVRAETDAAFRRGVFGAPFIFVDEEPFWGNDRLQEVDSWLTGGGW